MSKVVIFGAGQLAEVAAFYLTHDSPHVVEAFTVDSGYLRTRQLLGKPVVPFEDVEAHFPPDQYEMLVMVSYAQVNKLRAAKYVEAKQKGYRLLTYISSRACTWPDIIVGENCFIMENNVIQPYVSIGNDIIIWSGNHIGHHSKIEDHCFIASHAVISGSVRVGRYSFVGVNATIRDNVTIGEECVIGAGATILQDTKPRGVYAARPAQLLPQASNELEAI